MFREKPMLSPALMAVMTCPLNKLSLKLLLIMNYDLKNK